MSQFRLLCLLNRHRPVREEVVWTGINYFGICKHCGADIRRREGGGWRKRVTRSGPSQGKP